MESFLLKSRNGNLGIGKDYPIRVNCNVGINHISDIEEELLKIDSIFQHEATYPDIMMDLSTIEIENSIYKYIINNKKIPVGTLPTYISFNKHEGFSKKRLLNNIIKQASSGVSFFTFHFTANAELYQKAKENRKIPVTSRGGSLILYDSIKNNRKNNILLDCLDDIVAIAKEYDIALSLGTTFRPAGIIDACDEIHIKETLKQLEICRHLQNEGIKVMVENVGHIDIQSLEKHAHLLRKFKAPIMPLGPLPTDNAVGNDHIASAIGATFAGYWGCAHVINAISPNEHLLSKITLNDTIEGIKAAKIATHSINILTKNEFKNIDIEIYKNRALNKSCLNVETKNCYRCDELCPLNILS